MVAYTYKPQFEAPTLALIKIGTIRAIGKKRHVMVGEALQHYTGSRFRPRLFARSVCESVCPIRLHIHADKVEAAGWGEWEPIEDLDAFAVGDGFKDWDSMVTFWRGIHDCKRLGPWTGLWIRWDPDSVRAL
jgi:hypothetical protein